MSRIEQEKQTVEQMIRLYCRKKEGNETLCPQCREVLEYALLQTGDAGTDERNHEMGRAKNVVVSSGSGYPAFVAGVY